MDFTYPLTLESTSYLWGCLLLLPFWLFGFIKSKDSRKEMLICGLIFGLASVWIGYAYSNKDYWDPPFIFNNIFHLEDFLYGFFWGGISAEIFEIVTGHTNVKRNLRSRPAFVLIFLMVTILSFYLLVDVLGYNSMIALFIPPFFVGLVVIIFRRDFLLPVLFSGFAILILTFLWQSLIFSIYPGAVMDVWLVENLSGIFINGIPIEELIFGFVLGFGASSFYEFLMGYEYVK